MKPLTKILTAPLIWLSLVSPAIAGSTVYSQKESCGFTKSDMFKIIKNYDTNDDKRVSRKEFEEYYLRRIDYEGRETPDRVMEAKKKLESIFDEWDCNRDGYWDKKDLSYESMLAKKY